MTVMTREVGGLIREWRRRRRLSQLALAGEAEISQRHLSFLESGRARPSREMLLHLCEQLEVPLRERNLLLVAAGFAPHYPQRAWDDPAMEGARAVVRRVLAAHEPFPALAFDRHWTMLDANRAVAPLLDGVSARAAAPAGQPDAPGAASRGHRAARREPGGMARAYPGTPAPPGRADRRHGAGRAAVGTARLSSRSAAGAERRCAWTTRRAASRCRCGCGSAGRNSPSSSTTTVSGRRWTSTLCGSRSRRSCPRMRGPRRR